MSDTPIEKLKAIAHPLRFRILEVLRDGERNVGDIEEAAQIGQPALSQQLGVLRKSGLVVTRKESKQVYYQLDEEQLSQLADIVLALVPQDDAEKFSLRTPSPGVANFARLAPGV